MKTLIVGAGPFGLTVARLLKDAGRAVEIIERRAHLGGNAADEEREGVRVHRYGMHIFHTSDLGVWNFVNRFSRWRVYQHHVRVLTEEGVLPLPFTLTLFHQLYGVTTPRAMRALLHAFQEAPAGEDLASWAMAQVGPRVYELIIKGYTEKQWGRPCEALPRSILKRLPIRCAWSTRYFEDTYEGLPADGYQALWTRMAQGITIEYGVDFLADRRYWESRADRIVYTGPLDALWEYEFGPLAYRSLSFQTAVGPSDLSLGGPVLNNARSDCAWTRTYDWGALGPLKAGTGLPRAVLTVETPCPYAPGGEPYYPVRDPENVTRAGQYLDRTAADPRLVVGGRLGSFRYYDMHQAIRAAMSLVDRWRGEA